MITTPWGIYPDADAAAHALPMPFTVGDVVTLVTDGPAMTVEFVDHEHDTVAVVWFEQRRDGGWAGPMRDVFAPDMLIECAPNPNTTIH